MCKALGWSCPSAGWQVSSAWVAKQLCKDTLQTVAREWSEGTHYIRKLESVEGEEEGCTSGLPPENGEIKLECHYFYR